MPWSAIVQEIRNGDDRGVELLYLAVSDCARAQLYQSIDPQAVDDYVQEIAMIVLAAVKSGELRDANCLMGFVRTITRRQVAVHIRRAIFSRRRLVPVETTATPAAPIHESPEARFSAQERIGVALSVLGRLCPRDREILVRFYFDEQDGVTICREMTLTSTQFRLYKSRALAKCCELSQRSIQLPHSTRPLRIA